MPANLRILRYAEGEGAFRGLPREDGTRPRRLSYVFVFGIIVSIGMSLGGLTGYAINPARDLGPRIAHSLLPVPGKGPSNWGYAWIPVVAPIAGALAAVALYAAIPWPTPA